MGLYDMLPKSGFVCLLCFMAFHSSTGALLLKAPTMVTIVTILSKWFTLIMLVYGIKKMTLRLLVGTELLSYLQQFSSGLCE